MAVDSKGERSSTSIGLLSPLRETYGAVGVAVRRVPNWVLLGALVAAIVAIDVYWRVSEARPPHWDMAYHLANSVWYLHRASAGDVVSFFSAYQYYPPFTYWVTDAFYAVLGTEAMWVAVLSNVVWLAILVFATFAIGKLLWSVHVAWLSVAFVVTAPIVVSASKEYMLDLPLTAISALALYLLIRADGFSSRRDSLFLGAAVGCGVLVKWTLPLVLFLPVLHALATALSRARRRHELEGLVNALGGAAVALLIAGTWYVSNFRRVGAAAIHYNSPEGIQIGSPPVATPTSALWYFWKLLDPQLYLVPTVMLLVGIACCLWKREFAARNLYPILMVVGTYLAFTLLPTKDTRFTVPMLSAAAVLASSWIVYVAPRARTLITAAFVAYGAMTFAAVSFGTSLLPSEIGFDMPRTSFAPRRVTLFAQRGYIIGPPTRENWHQTDAFEAMAGFARSERRFSYTGPDTIWFNATGLAYYSLRYNAKRVDGDAARFLLHRSATATQTPPVGFEPLDRWRLPDGGTLVLYRRVDAGASVQPTS